MSAAAEPHPFDVPLRGLLGARTAGRLEKELGLRTCGELLDHVPRRWIERGELTSIASLPIDEQVTIVAEVTDVSTRRMHSRPGFIVDVTVADPDLDGSSGASLSMAYFNGHEARRRLSPGVRAMFQGKTTLYRGRVTLNNPDFTVLDAEAEGDPDVRPLPVYPATAKLPSWVLREAVETVLDGVDWGRVEDVPAPAVRAAIGTQTGTVALPDVEGAYRGIHAPDEVSCVEPARQSLALREALVTQAGLARRRAATRRQQGRAWPRVEAGLVDALLQRLPFERTQGQITVGERIGADLADSAPMSRLLQGDVGAGKTLVALLAMLQVVDAGGQAALVAPTEVLAQQHHRSLLELLGPLARRGDSAAGHGPFLFDEAAQSGPTTRVELLTGSMRTAARREAMLAMASGQAGITVGTHALLSEKVGFAQLGLVVVDEQHRFGVDQREALRRANPGTHLLVMSATPIPRSVAMTVFGDLDLTVLEGLPSGRRPVRTHVARVAHGPRIVDRVWEVIFEHVRDGRQAFVVCPRIDPDPEDPAHANVEDMLERMRRLPALAGVRVAAVHGRMEQAEQDEVMRAVAAGEVDVLVATTVIEVGVDVPNASVMAVLDAEDFGLSTLHQLRGRVGRGGHPALCLLVTRLPDGHRSLERLEVLEATDDGMRIAREDLRQRGVGDVLGAAQSGLRTGLRHLDVVGDAALVAFAADVVIEPASASGAASNEETSADGPRRDALLTDRDRAQLAAAVDRFERLRTDAVDYARKG